MGSMSQPLWCLSGCLDVSALFASMMALVGFIKCCVASRRPHNLAPRVYILQARSSTLTTSLPMSVSRGSPPYIIETGKAALYAIQAFRTTHRLDRLDRLDSADSGSASGCHLKVGLGRSEAHSTPARPKPSVILAKTRSMISIRLR